MWIRAEIVAEVEQVARVFYVDQGMAQRWNEHRRDGELRLMTGWVWSAKSGREERGGVKTVTAAYIDAYYRLVLHTTAPRVAVERKVA